MAATTRKSLSLRTAQNLRQPSELYLAQMLVGPETTIKMMLVAGINADGEVVIVDTL
jgi:hypothetical protein